MWRTGTPRRNGEEGSYRIGPIVLTPMLAEANPSRALGSRGIRLFRRCSDRIAGSLLLLTTSDNPFRRTV
jgi:hypothetical protein